MVLIILATISINAVLGENGIIRRAEQARQHQANAEAEDNAKLDELDEHVTNAMAGNGGSSQTPDEPVATTGPNGKPLTSTVTDAEHEGTDAEDTLGNPVHIPGGFKIAEDSGTTVKEGIVVEDTLGNQFVWIPVSNINHDGSNLIKIDEENEVEITLGRYTFDTGTRDSETNLYNGTGAVSTEVGKYQYAEDYEEIVKLKGDYQELTTKKSGENEVAKNLQGFVESVRDNNGYYLARYEAGIANVDTEGNPVENYSLSTKVATDGSIKPLSQYGKGIWNWINQADASYVCQNMYASTATVESYVENSYVESDLVNSYAWDTAIVYIQAMTNTAYACANGYSIGNTSSILNTGATGDQKCKIYDMAANVYEWTTEFGSFAYIVDGPPSYDESCTYRGEAYTADRYGTDEGYELKSCGYRPILYVK